jgi:signal transduction histidine kinase
VFRIFQEALTNVVRHAGASSVRVLLRATSDQLVLEIKDDGRGIAPAEQSDQRALGLLGMRERAQAAGGALEVLGSPGKGTTVALRMRLAAHPIELDAP